MKKKIIIFILFIAVLILSIIKITKMNMEKAKREDSTKTNISSIILEDNEEKNNSKKEKIIDYSCSVYFYNIEYVEFDYIGNKINLKDALKNGDISIEQIIVQAEEDTKIGKNYRRIANDGGSRIYIYDNFSILKMNSADGNRDLYIGDKNMSISEVK